MAHKKKENKNRKRKQPIPAPRVEPLVDKAVESANSKMEEWGVGDHG